MPLAIVLAALLASTSTQAICIAPATTSTAATGVTCYASAPKRTPVAIGLADARVELIDVSTGQTTKRFTSSSSVDRLV